MADDNRENEGFAEEELQVKVYDFRLMKRLLGFAARYWYLFALAVILLFASTAADLARPYLIGVAIDDFIKKGDAASLSRMGVYFLLLVVSGFLFNLLQIYVLSYAASPSYSTSGRNCFRTCRSCPSPILTKILSEDSLPA